MSERSERAVSRQFTPFPLVTSVSLCSPCSSSLVSRLIPLLTRRGPVHRAPPAPKEGVNGPDEWRGKVRRVTKERGTARHSRHSLLSSSELRPLAHHRFRSSGWKRIMKTKRSKYFQLSDLLTAYGNLIICIPGSLSHFPHHPFPRSCRGSFRVSSVPLHCTLRSSSHPTPVTLGLSIPRFGSGVRCEGKEREKRPNGMETERI